MDEMSFVKCYDAVTMVTDGVTSMFAGVCREDSSKKEKLHMSCAIIDVFSEEHGGGSYDVTADTKTGNIMVSLVCEDFETTTGSGDSFRRVLSDARCVGLRKYDEDFIEIDFVLDGIWVKV